MLSKIISSVTKFSWYWQIRWWCVSHTTRLEKNWRSQATDVWNRFAVILIIFPDHSQILADKWRRRKPCWTLHPWNSLDTETVIFAKLYNGKLGVKKVKETEEPTKAARVTLMTVQHKTQIKLMTEKAGACSAVPWRETAHKVKPHKKQSVGGKLIIKMWPLRFSAAKTHVL